MKRITHFGLLVLIILTSCDTEKNVSSQSSFELFVDSIVQPMVDQNQIAGASIAVYYKGELLLDKPYGYANLEFSVPIPENASFEIGSVTKQFTAAAILKLVQEEKISLEDDLTQYLDYDTKGRSIPISSLLNHTSGLPNEIEYAEEARREDIPGIMDKYDFMFEPGELLIYNNWAYFLLGLVIEKVSGKSYEEYLQEKFFIPLEMHNTYYCSSTEVVKNKVFGYHLQEEGLIQKDYIDHKWPFSAGSLCSTASDLLIWLRALRSNKVLPEHLTNLMMTPTVLNDGSITRYAMGIQNFTHYGHQIIRHSGSIPGFFSEVRYFPEKELYIVCLTNTKGGPNLFPIRPTTKFAEAISWKLLDKKSLQVSEIDFELDSISGRYGGMTRGGYFTFAVSHTQNSIIIKNEKFNSVDTISTYIGNKTWVNEKDNGLALYIFKDNQYYRDIGNGYIALKKMVE